MKTPLNLEHVKEIMTKDVLIGAESRKKFCFNPQANEFRIYLDGKYVSGGQHIELLLEEYNNL